MVMSAVSEDVVRDLGPDGKLRATINLGNIVLAQRSPDTGELGGVSVDLARELARRLGVEAELFPFDTAGKAFAALKSGTCNIGFLAIDPVRAAELDFTAPYVIIEATYLVSDSLTVPRDRGCGPGRHPHRRRQEYGVRSCT